MTIFLNWLIPAVCGGIVSFAVSLICKNKKQSDATKKGLQALLRAEIIRSYEKYEDRGYCPLYAKEALNKEYEAYHALGGNDVATNLYTHTMALQTEPPKKEK